MSDTTDTGAGDGPLAAEYALGVLEGPERASFEQRLAADGVLRAEVEAWQMRLAPLAEDIAPVTPPPRLWEAISVAIAPPPAVGVRAVRHRSRWSALTLWRSAAGAAAALAAVLLVLLLVEPEPPRAPSHVALLGGAQQPPSLLVEVIAEERHLRLRSLAGGALPDAGGRSMELWLIAAPGEAPRSLGLVGAAPADRPLAPDVAARLGPQSVLAISLEPPGGSPSGAPTGPVVLSGALVAVAR